MIRDSDPVGSTVSPEAHALILRKVAFAAVHDARAAWKTARDSPLEAHVRAAFRACAFAARALLRASKVLPDDEDALIEQSLLLNEVGRTQLRTLLTRWPDAEG